MPRYRVAILTAGGLKRLVVTGSDAKAVRLECGRLGRVVSVERVIGLGGPRRLSSAARQLLLLRVAGMVETRLPLVAALRHVGASFPGRIRPVAEQLADCLETGDDLPSAMGRMPEDFPPDVVGIVRATAQGHGNTAAGLRAAAEYEVKLAEINQGLHEGLWVSTANSALAAFTILATMFVFQPMLMETELMRTFQDHIQLGLVESLSFVAGAVVIAFLVMMAGLIGLATVGRAASITAADRLIARIPVFRDLVLGRERHRMLYELSLLIRSGIALDHALRMAAGTTNRGGLRADLIAAADAVAVGDDWPTVLASLSELDRVSIASAADRREIAHVFEVLARSSLDLHMAAVRMTRPALMSFSVVGLGFSGGILFGLLILPVLQVMDQMARG